MQQTSDSMMVKVFRQVRTLMNPFLTSVLTLFDSMLALSLGCLYFVTADNSSAQIVQRHALLASVGLRSIGTIAFWQDARGIVVYEAVWGLINAVAVAYVE